MIRIEVQGQSDRGPRRIYRVAERRVSADAPLPELEAFVAARSRRKLSLWNAEHLRPGLPEPPGGSRQLVFRGEAELARRQRHLECRWTGEGYELIVAGVGRFAVAADGGRIILEPGTGSRRSAAVTETVLGPALILALALQDVWCLHAGAVELDGRAVAFLGVSGAGKSTLARELPEVAGPPRTSAFRPAADDVLPATLAGGEARVLPHFPQLKYGPGAQPGPAVAGSLPLAAIYLLDAPAAGAAASRHDVAVEPLHGFAAALALVRHTVSARLFSDELLSRHTDFCIRLAGSLPVRRLRYPRTWQSLPRVAETVRRLAGRPDPARSTHGRPT